MLWLLHYRGRIWVVNKQETENPYRGAIQWYLVYCKYLSYCTSTYCSFTLVHNLLFHICVHVCYWLLLVWYGVGQAYFTSDMCLFGYYVITDIFVSLFMSYNITTLANTMRYNTDVEETEIIQNMFTCSAFSGTLCIDRPYRCRIAVWYGQLHMDVIYVQNVLTPFMVPSKCNTPSWKPPFHW